jgi:hypothetical protein
MTMKIEKKAVISLPDTLASLVKGKGKVVPVLN